MEQQKNPMEMRNKIIALLKIRGPSLPVHISKEIGLSSIFAGAFLSELASSKEIKISNMKVGGSPLYYLPGQETLLENFSNSMPGKEKEALVLLKEKKILEDRKQEPSIRVALRNIKDFTYPLTLNNEEKTIFWCFHSFPEEEAKIEIEKLVEASKPKPIIQEEIKPIIKVEQKELKPKIEQKKPEIKEVKGEKNERKQEEITDKKEIEKPLIKLKEKPVKIREKSDFVKKITIFLESENIELLEEKEFRKKEFLAMIRINSDIGKIKFLCIAKDKKTITDNDLAIALQKAQALKMPAFLISSGNLNKKASSYLENYSSLIKFRRV